jgi:hypothetical protein
MPAIGQSLPAEIAAFSGNVFGTSDILETFLVRVTFDGRHFKQFRAVHCQQLPARPGIAENPRFCCAKLLAIRAAFPSCEDLSDKPVVSIKLSKATVTI